MAASGAPSRPPPSPARRARYLMRFLAWLAAMRSSQVDSLASPRNVSMLLKTVTNTSWAMSSASARSPTRRSTRLNTRSPYWITSSSKARSSRARSRATKSRSPRLIGRRRGRPGRLEPGLGAAGERGQHMCSDNPAGAGGSGGSRRWHEEATGQPHEDVPVGPGKVAARRRCPGRPPRRAARAQRCRSALPDAPPAAARRAPRSGAAKVYSAPPKTLSVLPPAGSEVRKSSSPSTASTSGSVGVTAIPPPTDTGRLGVLEIAQAVTRPRRW